MIMIKVDLEQELLKQNQELINDFDLLRVNEYMANPEMLKNDALQRVGLNKNILKGKHIVDTMSAKKSQTEKFNKNRVFHISQIEKLCEKYYLRFLRTSYYSGTIDAELPIKITTFETAYDAQCNSYNTYIAAPAKSFKLEKKPKDPLFFYEINDEYFYLVHKWGDDLNIFRRCLSLLSNYVVSYFIIVLTTPLTLALTLPGRAKLFAIIPFIVLNIFFFFRLSWSLDFDEWGPLVVQKNKWNSTYL